MTKKPSRPLSPELVKRIHKNHSPAFAERLLAYARPTQQRSPTVKDFWLLTGVSAEQRIARMGESAEGMLALFKRQEPSRRRHTEVKRAVAEALRTCQVLDSPPPEPLVPLIEYLFGVHGKRPLHDPPWKKFIAAACFEAEHPGCSLRALAKASETDWHVVKNWRRREDFQELVQSKRRWLEAERSLVKG